MLKQRLFETMKSQNVDMHMLDVWRGKIIALRASRLGQEIAERKLAASKLVALSASSLQNPYLYNKVRCVISKTIKEICLE